MKRTLFLLVVAAINGWVLCGCSGEPSATPEQQAQKQEADQKLFNHQ